MIGYCKPLYFRRAFFSRECSVKREIYRHENVNTNTLCIQFSYEMQNLMETNFGMSEDHENIGLHGILHYNQSHLMCNQQFSMEIHWELKSDGCENFERD
jgi:hypothetical protein